MTTNMRAWTNRDFSLKTMHIDLILESSNQRRSTHTTTTISAPMTTYKNVTAFQLLWISRKPFTIFNENFFNESINVKMCQSPAFVSKDMSTTTNRLPQESHADKHINDAAIKHHKNFVNLYLIMSGKINTSPFDVSVPSRPSQIVRRVFSICKKLEWTKKRMKKDSLS